MLHGSLVTLCQGGQWVGIKQSISECVVANFANIAKAPIILKQHPYTCLFEDNFLILLNQLLITNLNDFTIMKKWLVILAVCIASVSCQWYYENIGDPADCAAWYLEQLYNAAIDEDVDKFIDLVDDLNEWESGLSRSELVESSAGGYEFGVDNPHKIQVLMNFADEYNIALFQTLISKAKNTGAHNDVLPYLSLSQY